jgi:hypothetical protein
MPALTPNGGHRDPVPARAPAPSMYPRDDHDDALYSGGAAAAGPRGDVGVMTTAPATTEGKLTLDMLSLGLYLRQATEPFDDALLDVIRGAIGSGLDNSKLRSEIYNKISGAMKRSKHDLDISKISERLLQIGHNLHYNQLDGNSRVVFKGIVVGAFEYLVARYRHEYGDRAFFLDAMADLPVIVIGGEHIMVVTPAMIDFLMDPISSLLATKRQKDTKEPTKQAERRNRADIAQRELRAIDIDLMRLCNGIHQGGSIMYGSVGERELERPQIDAITTPVQFSAVFTVKLAKEIVENPEYDLDNVRYLNALFENYDASQELDLFKTSITDFGLECDGGRSILPNQWAEYADRTDKVIDMRLGFDTNTRLWCLDRTCSYNRFRFDVYLCFRDLRTRDATVSEPRTKAKNISKDEFLAIVSDPTNKTLVEVSIDWNVMIDMPQDLSTAIKFTIPPKPKKLQITIYGRKVSCSMHGKLSELFTPSMEGALGALVTLIMRNGVCLAQNRTADEADQYVSCCDTIWFFAKKKVTNTKSTERTAESTTKMYLEFLGRLLSHIVIQPGKYTNAAGSRCD